ncbi:MAG: 50S ribosomal protein L19 [Phycisphaeraceae bacterium]|nr:50S ribosomal protein L19 [Phycisphaeraceae bacterium]
MTDALIRSVEQSHMKSNLPKMTVGDTVDVHVKIIEGSKERIQIFNGVIISRQGGGMNETITVRRIVANEGVERVFPLHSPRITDIDVKHHGHTRRAKLYYLRERVGKKRRLRDRRRGLGHLVTTSEPVAEPEAAPVEQAAVAEDASSEEAAKD